jgi:hypothetical protein
MKIKTHSSSIQKTYKKHKVLTKNHFNIKTYFSEDKKNQLFVSIESKYNLNFFKPAAIISKSKIHKKIPYYHKFLLKKKIDKLVDIYSKTEAISDSKYKMQCGLRISQNIKKTYYLLVLRSDHKTIPIAAGFVENPNYKKEIKKQSSEKKALSLFQRIKYFILKNSTKYYLENMHEIASSKLKLNEYLRNEVSFQKFNLTFKNEAKEVEKTQKYTVLYHTAVVGKSRFLINGPQCKIEYISSSKQLEMYFLQEQLIGACKVEGPTKISIRIDSIKIFRGRWLSLLHNGSENWLHWITEVLPRLFADYNSLKELDGILVDTDLPQSMYSSLNIVGVRCRIEKIPRYTLVKCEYLVVPKVPCFCLMWEKDYKKILGGEWKFDEGAIKKMQKSFNSGITCERKYKAIYIRRKSTFRKIINENALHKTLVSKGFEVITPSSKNINDIIYKMKCSKVFILQAGAAFGNTLFAPLQSTFFIICSQSKRIHLNYLKKIGTLLNQKLVFIKSPWDKKSKYNPKKIYSVRHPVNANLKVNIEKLVKRLS